MLYFGELAVQEDWNSGVCKSNVEKAAYKHLAPPALAANPVDVFAFLTALKKQIPVWAGLLFSGQICFFQGVEKTNGILWGCAVCQAAHEP